MGSAHARSRDPLIRMTSCSSPAAGTAKPATPASGRSAAVGRLGLRDSIPSGFIPRRSRTDRHRPPATAFQASSRSDSHTDAIADSGPHSTGSKSRSRARAETEPPKSPSIGPGHARPADARSKSRSCHGLDRSAEPRRGHAAEPGLLRTAEEQPRSSDVLRPRSAPARDAMTCTIPSSSSDQRCGSPAGRKAEGQVQPPVMPPREISLPAPSCPSRAGANASECARFP